MSGYLEEHVSWFYPSVGSHSSALHDGADVNASVSPVVALTDDADPQEVVLLCQRHNTKSEKKPCKTGSSSAPGRVNGREVLPMLSVTVMMLRLIVESVMLLKDED